MSSSTTGYLLQFLMSTGPTVLVAVVGLLLTFVNWNQLGRAALLAAGGFGLHLFASLSYLAVSTFLINLTTSGSATSVAMKWSILSVVNGTLHAAALALLLAALLTPRPPAQ